MKKDDIFSNGYDNTYTFSASGAAINWYAGSNVKGSSFPLIVTQLELTYTRGVSTLYPLNTTNNGFRRLNMIGAPTGTMRIQTILTPDAKDLKNLLTTLGRSCIEDGDGVSMTIRPFNACKDHKIIYTIHDAGLAALNLNIISGESGLVTISQPLTIYFTSMEISNLS